MFVYLIGQENNNQMFKIGFTRAKSVQTRLKALQTGNAEKLYIKDYFETDTPSKLEKLLHFHFYKYHYLNEWYELNQDNIKNFKSTCEMLQERIESLKENPYF